MTLLASAKPMRAVGRRIEIELGDAGAERIRIK